VGNNLLIGPEGTGKAPGRVVDTPRAVVSLDETWVVPRGYACRYREHGSPTSLWELDLIRKDSFHRYNVARGKWMTQGWSLFSRHLGSCRSELLFSKRWLRR
jgi:hypothetical protein